MGWKPFELYRTTVWEFWQAWDGWYALNAGGDNSDPMTRSELETLIREYGPNVGRTEQAAD